MYATLLPIVSIFDFPCIEKKSNTFMGQTVFSQAGAYLEIEPNVSRLGKLR